MQQLSVSHFVVLKKYEHYMNRNMFFNILSDERKEEMKKKKLFLMFQFQVIVAGCMFVLLCLFLFGIWQSIAYQTRSFQVMIDRIKQSQLQYRELQTYEENFSQINKKLLLAEGVLRNEQNLSGVIAMFGALVPEKVRIEGITVRNRKFFVRGVSDSRDTLSIFQDILKNDDCFSDLSIPLESWVQKESPSFEIEINLSDTCQK